MEKDKIIDFLHASDIAYLIYDTPHYSDRELRKVIDSVADKVCEFFEDYFLERFGEILNHESVGKLDNLLGNYMDTDIVKLHDMAVGAKNVMDWLNHNGFPKELRELDGNY